METRKVLVTFKNGGKLIELHPKQLEWLKKISGHDIAFLVSNGELKHTLQMYRMVINKVAIDRRYMTGNQANILNELRCKLNEKSRTK